MKKKGNFNKKVSPNNFVSAQPVESDSSGLILPFEDAKALADDPLNGVNEVELVGKMAVLPGDLQHLQTSVGHLLDARLFYYLPAAEGILIAYRDLRITCRTAATFCDRPFAHIVYSARAIVFRPRIGQQLRGVVSQLSSIKRHVTCILCDVLNVTIPLEESHNQPSLRVGDVIYFELTSFTLSPNGTVSLVGRLCDVKELANVIGGQKPLFATPAVKKSPNTPHVKHQPQTPTWLNPTTTTQQRQTAQHIYYESSSSDDDSSSSSESSADSKDSLSVDLHDKPLVSKQPKSSALSLANGAKEKGKQRLAVSEDTQNGCITPTRSLRKKQSSKMEDEPSITPPASLAKLEPMTPNRLNSTDFLDNVNNKSDIIPQQHHKSAKKRKYLAD